MSADLPHVVKGLVLAALVPALLAACQPGWSEKGPVTGPRSMAAAGRCPPNVHVYPGDTLFSIAKRCDVSVRDLIDANALAAPYMLEPGRVLRMPGGGTDHVVRKGDTLSVLARRYGVDLGSLARVNGKGPPYTIFIGEKLRIPGAHPAAAKGGDTLVIASPNARTETAPRPTPPPRIATVQPSPAPGGERRQSAQPQISQPQISQPQPDLPPEPPPLAGRDFGWPLKGEVVAEFGPVAKGQNNDGLNIAAAKGSPVQAAENGVVAYSGNEINGFGNLLLIKHADGWMTAYAHNEKLLVRKGEAVTRGQPIATVGQTGSVDAPQLHFEIRRGTEAVDPRRHLPQGMAWLRIN